mmetsp:Transcript_38182/g.68176  ORF Transcript_38182/g.68176 Transcript_38182/m.68176 type:complete len:83 (-) Transcript_38182:9-257(-)
MLARPLTYYADCQVQDNSNCRSQKEIQSRIMIARAKKQWKPRLENVFMNACELLFDGKRHYELTADDYYHLKKRGRSSVGLG